MAVWTALLSEYWMRVTKATVVTLSTPYIKDMK